MAKSSSGTPSTGDRAEAAARQDTLDQAGPARPVRAGGLEAALVLDMVRVTEQAAIAASRVAGKGDPDLVDQAGVDAMRLVLNELPIAGEIVIGEGERDEAPM